MLRLIRNLSATLFLAVALVTPVQLSAYTCLQYGILHAGDYCFGQHGSGSGCANCVENECLVWADLVGGGYDCWWDCAWGGLEWCE